jgi:serine/threonine protein kinase
MMKMIQHQNIVKLKEVLSSNSKIYLVLELIKGGDLFDHIKGNDTGN